MTKKPRVTVQTRNGKITARVRHGWFEVDGIAAVIVILIIVTVRISRAVVVVTVRSMFVMAKAIYCSTRPRAASAARHISHHATGLYRGLRAFYIP